MLAEYARQHLLAGIAAYAETGSCPSFAWASSPYETVTATRWRDHPSVERMSTVHAIMTHLIGASAIGRTDEAWMRPSLSPEQAKRLRPGDLARIAKTDPEVRTAIMVQAIDVDSGIEIVLCGIQAVADDGSEDWHVTQLPIDQVWHDSGLSKALDLAFMAGPINHAPSTDYRTLAVEAIERMGWVIEIMYYDDVTDDDYT